MSVLQSVHVGILEADSPRLPCLDVDDLLLNELDVTLDQGG